MSEKGKRHVPEWVRNLREMRKHEVKPIRQYAPDREGQSRAWKHYAAAEMKRAPTRTESMLWAKLQKRNAAGADFERQVVLFGYIADFYSPSAKLVIEVDGPVHAEQRRRDQERDRHLREHGLEVMRFSDLLITDYLPAVVDQIVKTVAARQPRMKPRGPAQEQWVEVGTERARRERGLLRDENGWVEVPRKRGAR